MNETSSEVIQMTDWLSISITLAAVFVPLAGAVFVWWLKQHSKIKWQMRKQKERRYKAFLESMEGYYAARENKEKKDRFLSELRLAYLYCPDDVIRAGNTFLDTVEVGANSSDGKRKQALAEFELSLRRDIYGRTALTTNDYRVRIST